MQKLVYLQVMIIIMGVNFRLFAQPTIVLDETQQTYDIGLHLTILEDKLNNISFEDLQKPVIQQMFKPSTRMVPNFGQSTSGYWLHFRVDFLQGKKRWLLELKNVFVDTVQIYQLSGDSLVYTYLTGDNYPFQQRAIPYRNFVFPITLDSSQPQDIYLHFKGRFAKQFPLQIIKYTSFLQEAYTQDALLFAILGALLILGCYNLFIYFSLREAAYFYYVLFSFCTVILLAALTGLFFQYVLPQMPRLNNMVFNLSAYLDTILGSLFMLHFLKTKEFFPKIYKVFLWLTILPVSVAMLLILWVNYFDNELIYYCLHFSGVFIAGLIITGLLIAVLTLVKKRYPPAKFYLIGWIFIFIGAFVMIMRQLGWVEDNFITSHVFPISFALENVVLSLGLGYTIIRQRKENAAIQEQRITLLRKNEQIVLEQNLLLEERVKERTKELVLTHEKLEMQKNSLAEQNRYIIDTNQRMNMVIKDLQDSIDYAKLIQKAMLPTTKEIKAIFPDSFVLFRPRETVSGDFYFFAKKNNRLIVAAVDATGHGVPGAFMSLIGHDLLNQIVNIQGITAPDEILNHLRRAIIAVLHQRENQNHDGMDLVVCSVNYNRQMPVLEYAGAINPLIYFQQDSMQQIVGDRIVIGGLAEHFDDQTFTLHQVLIDQPTTFYLFSDGIKDQFGGEKNRKFSTARLYQLLKSIQHLPINEQQKTIESAIEAWQGSQPQTDDMLLVAIKIDHQANL